MAGWQGKLKYYTHNSLILRLRPTLHGSGCWPTATLQGRCWLQVLCQLCDSLGLFTFLVCEPTMVPPPLDSSLAKLCRYVEQCCSPIPIALFIWVWGEPGNEATPTMVCIILVAYSDLSVWVYPINLFLFSNYRNWNGKGAVICYWWSGVLRSPLEMARDNHCWCSPWFPLENWPFRYLESNIEVSP